MSSNRGPEGGSSVGHQEVRSAESENERRKIRNQWGSTILGRWYPQEHSGVIFERGERIKRHSKDLNQVALRHLDTRVQEEIRYRRSAYMTDAALSKLPNDQQFEINERVNDWWYDHESEHENYVPTNYDRGSFTRIVVRFRGNLIRRYISEDLLADVEKECEEYFHGGEEFNGDAITRLEEDNPRLASRIKQRHDALVEMEEDASDAEAFSLLPIDWANDLDNLTREELGDNSFMEERYSLRDEGTLMS